MDCHFQHSPDFQSFKAKEPICNQIANYKQPTMHKKLLIQSKVLSKILWFLEHDDEKWLLYPIQLKEITVEYSKVMKIDPKHRSAFFRDKRYKDMII